MTTRLPRRQMLRETVCLAAGLSLPACIFNTRLLAFTADEPLDVLIHGGQVIDGTGSKAVAADVAIRVGKIAAVGKLADHAASKKIDATGLVITPGFIDMHTHSDRTLLRDGLAQSAVRQGSTTHVVGNCGSSPAPLRKAEERNGNKLQSYGDFFAALTDTGVSINVCGLVGHNRVRATVMGYENRPPSESEMREMRELVAAAMKSGATGMSTGLVSPPGTFSQTDEIVELATEVGKAGGVYATHMRGEASTLVNSVREALEIGRRGRVPVQISHHKAAGKENWGKTRITLLMIEEANQQGQPVRVDVYPYRAGSAGLSQLVPPWAHEGGNAALLKRLQDPETRKRIARDMSQGTADWPNYFTVDWDDIQIAGVKTQDNQQWVGKKVGDLARARGCAGADACIDLLIEEQGGARMINFIMDEDEVRRVLAHPLSLIGSDGTAVAKEWAEGKPHPRYYGCMPRVLGYYARQEKVLPLETAVRKMTGASAAQLGLANRGLIKTDYAADLVLLDPQKVIDRATFVDPHQYPEGFAAVMVNGQITVDGNEHTQAKAGQVLSPERG